MPKQKRNHFISEGHIKFWALNKKKVWMWEKDSEKGLVLRTPKAVHFEEFLYARWDTDGKRDMSAEEHLKLEIDDHFPQLIKSVVNRWPNAVPLSQRERELLARVSARMVLRHPSIIGWTRRGLRFRLARFLLRLNRWISRKDGRDLAVERYGKTRIIDGEIRHLAAVANIDQVLAQIQQQVFGFYALEEGSQNFVLGSQPFILNPNGEADDMRFGLALHPRILLGIFERTQDHKEDFQAVMTSEDAKRINGYFIRQSKQIVMVNQQDVEGAYFDTFKPDGSSERHVVSIEKPDQRSE